VTTIKNNIPNEPNAIYNQISDSIIDEVEVVVVVVVVVDVEESKQTESF